MSRRAVCLVPAACLSDLPSISPLHRSPSGKPKTTFWSGHHGALIVSVVSRIDRLLASGCRLPAETKMSTNRWKLKPQAYDSSLMMAAVLTRAGSLH